MTIRQAGTMLQPRSAGEAEHRKTATGSPEYPMNPSVSATRQSGLQSGAQSQHHLGSSFPLAQPHYIQTSLGFQTPLNRCPFFGGKINQARSHHTPRAVDRSCGHPRSRPCRTAAGTRRAIDRNRNPRRRPPDQAQHCRSAHVLLAS